MNLAGIVIGHVTIVMLLLHNILFVDIVFASSGVSYCAVERAVGHVGVRCIITFIISIHICN